jgi:phosphoglycerate dehydrogenase-like enzyme
MARGADRKALLVEDDPITRFIQVVLDPGTSRERQAAFADFVAHDVADFAGWCARVRHAAAGLYPAEVRLVTTQEELTAGIGDADAVVVESLQVRASDLRGARRLKVVQKFGVTLRNIDLPACAQGGVQVLSVRRRPNIACAEHALALMLMLARRAHEFNGVISAKRLEAAGFPYKPFDRRHAPNGNWGRIPGLRTLHGATLGIIGLGEIGREIALRAAAFDMRILYFQRTRLPEAEESALGARYCELDRLLAESDWLVPQLPAGRDTRHFLDEARLAKLKRGACIVNVARADLIDRGALIAALSSGRVGGFALDPLYEAPGRDDDELLRFPNVILLPHLAGSPRWNALRDCEDVIVGLAKVLA